MPNVLIRLTLIVDVYSATFAYKCAYMSEWNWDLWLTEQKLVIEYVLLSDEQEDLTSVKFE